MKLDSHINRLIKIIASTCKQLSINAYLVGGPVRDMLMGESNIDLDIAVDTDVEKLVNVLARKFQAKFIYHHRFKTATLFLDKFNIDLAATREEVYPYQGALPRVRNASLKKDLFRRDFTINAAAIEIKESGLACIIDPYNGLSDIKNKKIRILHKNSFKEDPTRIIRAIRFHARFRFSFERDTFILLKSAVSGGMLSKVTPARIGKEIIKLLKENDVLICVKELNKICGLSFIDPRIRLNKTINSLFADIPKYVRIFKKKTGKNVEPWIIYFIALTDNLEPNELNNLCRRFEMERSFEELILHAHSLNRTVLKKPGLLKLDKPSSIYSRLKPIYPEAMIYLIARLKNRLFRRKLLDFFFKSNRIKLKINGEDLKRMGFTPGPVFHKILEAAYLAKLDCKFSGRSQELKFVRDNFGHLLSH